MSSQTDTKIDRVRLAEIRVPAERRARVDEAVVERLVQSIERRGLLSPIRIREDSTLVCGLHCLAACERLGWEEVDAIYCESDEVDAELDEIEENLCRRDLTVLERCRAERRQKELYLLRHPETKQGVAGAQSRHGLQPKALSFAAREAKPGDGRRMREQRIQIAEALSEETVHLVADHPLASNHTQLLALARAPTDLRHDVASLVVTRRAKTVAAALASIHRLEEPTSTNGSHKKAAAAGEAPLVPVEGHLRGEFIVAGRRLLVQIPTAGSSLSWRDLGVEPRSQTPSIRDERILTVPLSVNVAAEVVADLPADLAQDVTVGEVEVEDWCRCSTCGGSDFWRSYAATYRCRACPDPHEGRHPFQIMDRVDVRSPRLIQTLAVRPSADARKQSPSWVRIQWWNAPDRFRAEPLGSVLVEVVGGAFAFVGGRRRTHVEDFREVIFVALMQTFWFTHGLVERKGRHFRTDGTAVLLVHRPR